MHADDLILISVDDHIAEPATMFDAHVPAKYKEFAPRVREDENGRQRWWYGEARGRNLGLNAVAGKDPRFYNIDASRYDEMRSGCWNVHDRVKDMSAGGQLAGLNFPNWTGFSGQVLNQGPDADINEIMIRAYNDWHIDEWCGSYPGRFIPCGMLPLFDIDRAVAEVNRLASKGCYAVTFSENPEALGMPSIHSGEWDKLFAVCCDNGTILCCHLGSSSKSAATSADAPPGVPMTMSSAGSVFTLGDLMWAEFWGRFPDLKFSITEGDIGWMPYFVWRAEHVLDRHNGWMRHSGMGPREVFEKHILCCFINEPIGVELIEHFNLDNVSWESDYPHSDGTWPNAPEMLAERLSALSDEQIRKISHENAMKHYRFDPFQHRPKEKCTAAALRAESPDVDTVTHEGREADERDLEQWREITNRVRVAQS